jgi:cell division protein FtsB
VTDGHRTSTIARPQPREVVEPKRRRRSNKVAAPAREARPDDRPSIISDFTTPIERTKQLVPQRRGRLVVALFSLVIALAIGAALFVLPIKSWLQQRDDLAVRSSELDVLDSANDQLQLEVDRLQTDAGVREAAREVIDYVEAGEQRLTVLPIAPAPTTLPPGWPYDLITRIVTLRQQEAAEAPSAAVSPAPAP